ncbi:hypothetical protein BT63DRAFT_74364 [Microthyrium microscopicum]|uniref:Zn(2)-C6 fungal-type domain-containing protein n=1 Tax=Microthyrium microscopicum TaxID=703497 RepID=A0A6A6U457_9PEZI|nr:hypothetical protein BT63DRAFT_74364 [Microthyrium microscopicum]
MAKKPELQFADIQTDGSTSRVRRTHRKSRYGCSSCKARKIKCDEKTPKCSACRRRGDECIRPPKIDNEPEDEKVKFTSIPSSHLDLMNIRLFYQFEHQTLHTLALGGRPRDTIWKENIQMALTNEYLMHSLLAIAAAHLLATQPHDQTIADAELQHQTIAINGCRLALNANLSDDQASHLFAFSVLLLHYAWAKPEQNEVSMSGIGDLIPLGKGIKGIVIEQGLLKGSLWAATMAYSPKIQLAALVNGSDVPAELHAAFKRHYMLLRPDDARKDGDEAYQAYHREVVRVVPVISVLKLRDRGMLDVSRLDHAISRYLFTWPILMSAGMVRLEKQGDMVAYLLMFHFFSAVANAKVESMWWAQRRAKLALERLRHQLREYDVDKLDFFSSPEAPGIYAGEKPQYDKCSVDCAAAGIFCTITDRIVDE